MKFLTISFFLIINTFSFSQDPNILLLESVFIKTKETSMYRNEINWDSLIIEAYKVFSSSDLKESYEVLLNGIRDHHGRIIDAHNYSTIAHFTDYKNSRYTDKRTFSDNDWKLMNDTSKHFEFSYLKGQIGYLKLYGIAPNVDIIAESEKIRNGILELAKKPIKGWIIDLRYNTGGNMNPMMAGLGPLIGDGQVGRLVTGNGEVLDNWRIENGNFIYNSLQAVDLPQPLNFKQDQKIAVLTSRWTTSSGELVATTLKNRTNTRFFGEATGGYTTNTGWEYIGNDIILCISTGVFSDREGIVYDKNIPVDVEIPFQITSKIKNDEAIKSAIKWLKL